MIQTDRHIHKSDFFKDNKPFVVAIILFLCGMLVGAWSLTLDSSLNGADDLIVSTLQNRATQPFYSIFFSSFLSHFAMLLILFLCGCCSFGWLIIFLCPLYRGFCLGLVSGTLYLKYALIGIGYNSLVLLMGGFISALCIAYAVKVGFNMSMKYFYLLSSKSKHGIPISQCFKQYSVDFAVIFGFAVLSAVADSCLSVCFAGYFSL